MGISRLTAYAISSSENIVIDAGGPSKDNGKYVGWITLGEGDNYRPLLNTQAIYDTAAEAKKAMEDIVKEVKKFVEEETGGKHPIDHVMGEGKEAETIKDIINKSKE